jgi:hypothetical protein
VPGIARIASIGFILLLSATPANPRARVVVGGMIDRTELPTLAGGKEPITTAKATVNVIVFWRPDQQHSLETLKQMSKCEEAFAGKSVHFVTVVSDSYPIADVKAAYATSALHAPILIDKGDEVYGKLEVVQHPLVVVTDSTGKVTIAQPYERIRACDLVLAHVRFLLKEIDAAQLAALVNPERATMPDDDKRNIARRFVRMGKMEAEGDCNAAMKSFAKALEIVPNYPDALAAMAECKKATATAKR